VVLDLERVVSVIREVCSRFEDVVYAVLFGSWALGVARPYSDVDVAIKLRYCGGDCLSRVLDIGLAIEDVLGVHVDAIPVDLADTVLRYEIFSCGKLVFCRDEGVFWDDYLNAIDQFLDFEPVFRRFSNRVIEEVLDAYSRCEG